MQQILVIAGCRQSGKSTSAKYITGIKLKQANILNWFDIAPTGELLVEAIHENNSTSRDAILDLYRQDFEFMQYASQNIWPYCKIYSLANILKQVCANIFSLNPINLYGSDEDKNKLTNINWKSIQQTTKNIKENKKDGDFLSHRELLQEFGTICRNIQDDCWIQACYNHIKEENYPYVIIDDCRYENEIKISKKNNAKIILLQNQPIPDGHNSEKILTFDRKLFDFTIDNRKMSLKEKNDELTKIMIQIGWLTAKIINVY